MTTTETVRFGDFAGSATPLHNDLQQFLKVWFDPEEIIIIQVTPENNKPTFISTTREELLEDTESFLELKSDDGIKQTLYFQVNPAEKHLENYGSRTRKEAGVKEIRGFYADLDLKTGSFSSTEDIMNYLRSLEVKPTVAIESGSGGIHAYWRASGEVQREDLRAWWTYLQSMAPEGVNIDRLIDAERVLRVPGSIRWGKDGNKTNPLKLIGGTGEATPVERFRELTKASYEAHRTHLLEVRKRDNTLQSEMDGVSIPGFNNFLLKALIESKVNKLTWDEVLIPNGWTYLRTDYGGSRQWVRPGSSQKSATTDYTHADGTVSDVMSLLSSSPDSGLLDLKDAGIPLTKYRVLLRLTYKDDVTQLIQEITRMDKK